MTNLKFYHTIDNSVVHAEIVYTVQHANKCDAKLYVEDVIIRKRDGRKYHDNFLAVVYGNTEGDLFVYRWDDDEPMRLSAFPKDLLDYLKGNFSEE